MTMNMLKHVTSFLRIIVASNLRLDVKVGQRNFTFTNFRYSEISFPSTKSRWFSFQKASDISEISMEIRDNKERNATNLLWITFAQYRDKWW